MKVLIVANHNNGYYAPFIVEQVNALQRLGIEIDYYGIHGKGYFGYLSNLTPLKAKIEEYQPDLIHAHYGLSGLLANLQRKVPVVTTYHGSDIHSEKMNLFLSRFSMRLSAYNIFVSKGLHEKADYHGRNQCIQPCGVEINTFSPIDRLEARKLLGWDANGKYILFAGSFDSEVKNSPLAKAAVSQIEGVHLMELRGYTREQVNWAMNASNCLLITSLREGSPLVIKEALVCGTPIVSVNVGDVEKNISGIEGCYLTSYDVQDVVKYLQKALCFEGKTNGRQRVIELHLSNEFVAQRLMEIYNHVVMKK